MTSLSALPRRARFRTAAFLSTRPALYFGLLRITGRLDSQCVKPDTGIVIEGFPRSANSTTVHKFLERQTIPMHVAHHKHHAAQLLLAAKWELPSVALIREPRGACLSLLALTVEAKQRANRSPSPDLTFGDALIAYSAFYEAVEAYLDRIVIGRFEHLHDDICNLVDQINESFSTNFRREPIIASPQDKLGWHAMPNPMRNDIKAQLEERFKTEVRKSATMQRLLSKAQAVLERYVQADERSR